MASPWEKQFKTILKRAGTELRRTGDEVKAEAQRIIEEMRDPERQARMREQLDDLRGWAKKTSKDLVDMVETAVTKMEGVLSQAPAEVKEATGRARNAAAQATAKVKDAAKPRAKAASKTVGRAPGGARKATGEKEGAAKKPVAKKTVGRKPAGAGETGSTTVGKRTAGPKPKAPASKSAPKARGAAERRRRGAKARKTGGRGKEDPRLLLGRCGAAGARPGTGKGAAQADDASPAAHGIIRAVADQDK